jgi:hypothetical protein
LFCIRIISNHLQKYQNTQSAAPQTRMMTGACGANMLTCLVDVASSAGVLALYASLFATWARLAPWNILNFVSLERYRRLLAPKAAAPAK